MRHAVTVVLLSALACSSAAAQREPVLQQIKVPHNYYYREMYLPQATSGPGWVTWSPDGSEVIYSMQGTLWRQKLGTNEAWQLTSGGGYDYQPDWSPDGRWVVFSSYRADAMELRVLNLKTGESGTLLGDGAVNLEPRWSPDGSRIAFVSTSYDGRWHVYAADFADGALRKISRITEDRDSKLPRYYYSRFDHYLSPTWSPDGKSLILISNRDHIWGSGGFWRVGARSGAPMRLIHDEETTWKARPDWARDGRVVYSSYLGRQWNQLWLMTGEGGDALQLTYGDYDATNPRWSPDGRRIAFIVNQHGNTELRVLTLPGSAVASVHADRRHYRGPMGSLRMRIVDAATGQVLSARVSVATPEGLSLVPDSAWRHADDGFVRSERHFEYGYFHATGSASLKAPAGRVMIEISHGPEYRVWRDTVTVTADSVTLVRAALTRIADLRRSGWTSGDLHVHMNYGGHYRATPATLAGQARAEGLNLVENLIVNKEGRMPDIGYQPGRPDPVSRPDLLVVHDQEYHTSYWGHTGVIGLTDHVLLPGYAAYVNTPVASLYPDNATIGQLAHDQGALFGYVHPFDEYPDPSNREVALNNALPVDVALGKVDYYEVIGFSDHLSSAKVWYQLLNSGFRIAAGAGTDAMTNYASLRGPVGTDRVYVHSGAALDHRRWLDSLKAGRSFATNGPLLGFAAGRTGIGGEVRLARPGTLSLHVSLTSIVPIDHFEIVNNGAVVATIPLGADRTHADTTVSVPVNRSGWFALRAWSDKPVEPILDLYPFSHTSPIYVIVADQPIRSDAAAQYFLAWLDRLEENARAFRGWNSEMELGVVLGHIIQARAVFESRRTVAAGPFAPDMVAIRAGRLIDVDAGVVLEDRVLVLKGDRIFSIEGGDFLTPPGMRTIDLSNSTVLPGLIDCHTHLIGDLQSSDVLAPLKTTAAQEFASGVRNARITLMAGFTTVRDVGTYRGFLDVALRDSIAHGTVPGPRMLVAGAYVTIRGGGGEVTGDTTVAIPAELRRGVANGEAEVRQRVNEILDHGADWIKVIATGAVLTEGTDPGQSEYSEVEIRAAVEEAGKRERWVAAHAHGAEGIKRAVRAGVRSIEHGSLMDDEGIRLMHDRGTWLVADIFNGDYIAEEGRKQGWPADILRKNDETTDTQRAAFRKAVAAGVHIAYGTDSGVYPHAMATAQLPYMVRYGMTPIQAVQSATIDAARLLGMEDRIGSLAPGKLADIIAVPGDLTARLDSLAQLGPGQYRVIDVPFVMQGGKVVKDDSNR